MKLLSHQRLAGSAQVGLRNGSTPAQASMNTCEGVVSKSALKKVGNEAYLLYSRQFYSSTVMSSLFN